jgi:DNA polymerase-3 subunit chi
MTAVQFYHLTATPLERALPKLVEKIYGAGHRVLLVDSAQERLDSINQVLWTYSTLTFLPHGSTKEPSPEEQPILLSPVIENKNQADILLITDGSVIPDKEQFARVLDIFDGNDKEAIEKARARWKKYQDEGLNLMYLKQTESGSWEEKKVA